MREIVTLQLGNFSNYAATHFWNAQESYFTFTEDEKQLVDHNIHWRAGKGVGGADTFLPRAVVYDLKGAFGGLRKVNALYDVAPSEDDVASTSLWSSKPVVRKQDILDPSDYQKSIEAGTKPGKITMSSVRHWSDFSRVYYHPKSLVQLYDYELHSNVMPFENFPMGSTLFESLQKESEIVDRDWRPFVEECDQMQGVQIYTTLDDAWGGFACSYLEALRDEHPKTCIWVWGMQHPMAQQPREKRRLLLSNTAQSLYETCAQASIVVPLATPESSLPSSVAVNSSSTWENSGLLATAAESSLLPSRLIYDEANQRTTLADIAQRLNVSGSQNLANIRMCIGPTAGELEDNSQEMDISQIWGYRDQGMRKDIRRNFGQLLTIRGFDGSWSSIDYTNPQRHIIGDTVLQRYTTSLPFPLLDSFPPIYYVSDNYEDIQVRTSVSCDSSTAPAIKHLRSQVRWSISFDERESLDNGLAELASAYEDGWSNGSDQDDDDS